MIISSKSNPKYKQLSSINTDEINDYDADRIIDLSLHGYTQNEIKQEFYPCYSFTAIDNLLSDYYTNKENKESQG